MKLLLLVLGLAGFAGAAIVMVGDVAYDLEEMAATINGNLDKCEAPSSPLDGAVTRPILIKMETSFSTMLLVAFHIYPCLT